MKRMLTEETSAGFGITLEEQPSCLARAATSVLPAGCCCGGGGYTCACSGYTWTNSRRSYSRRHCCSSGPGCLSSLARRTPCPRRWPRPAGDEASAEFKFIHDISLQMQLIHPAPWRTPPFSSNSNLTRRCISGLEAMFGSSDLNTRLQLLM